MAAPTAPTRTTLVSEALKRAGVKSPVSALTTRAEDLWMEEIKNDILVMAKGRKLKPLFTTSVSVTVNNKSRYSNPADYFSDLSLEILDGANKGTATGGAAGSITLASSVTGVEGYNILVTSGTGVGSMSQCTSFNTSTLVATVSPNFTTAPASGSTYTIIDTIYPLAQKPIREQRKQTGVEIDVPEVFYPVGDADYGEFELYPVPDNGDYVFGLRMNYYANFMTLDLAGALMATLYQRWRNIWLQGVYAKALAYELDDKRAETEMLVYRQLIADMIRHDAYGIDDVETTPTILFY